MPNDNIKNMVNSLASGDNVKAQDAFKNALSDKIGQALDNKRQSVATDWLGSAKELEATKAASGLDKVQGAVTTPMGIGSADNLAAQTPGFAGAEIANVCNESALIAARKNKKTIEMDDVQDAIDRVIGGLEKKNKLISPEEKKIVAFRPIAIQKLEALKKHFENNPSKSSYL